MAEVTADPRLDQARQLRSESRPLPADLRERFERALGADLTAVRVHVGPDADAVARAFGSDAVTAGSAVFFRHGAYRPEEPAGLRLLAHEVAHTVQQARGGLGGPEDAQVWEAEADRFAEAFVAGVTPEPLRAVADGRGVLVAAGPSGVVQRHASFEHRWLGDGPPSELYQVSVKAPGYKAILARQITLCELFRREDPQDVTEDDVRTVIGPDATLVRLGPDRILATLGEVNALPDYLANPEQVDGLGGDMLVPILQVIRQEGYNQFKKLESGKESAVHFPRSPFAPSGSGGTLDAVYETLALDRFTAGLGPGGQDHYMGLLARNACHFAPYTWYRWLTHHLAARELAAQAFRTSNPDQKQELTRRAWNHHGYADHFLEDSFAAGHLIDKTLVMQWFVEWAGDSGLVADHEVLRYMTAALQPGLAAGQLYEPSYRGPSHDPQTVQEMRLLAERVRGGGNSPGRERGRMSGYVDYLTFLSGAAGQLAAVLLHNNYNAQSLWVSSVAHPAPYRIWGDDTLLSGQGGGEGVLRTAETAQMSREALRGILADGGTAISPEKIRAAFPTRAGSSQTTMTSLGAWATGQRAWVEENIFRGISDELGKLLARLAQPRLGVVSRDQPLGEQWNTPVSQSDLRMETAALLPFQGRLFAASDGYAFELDPGTGATSGARTVELPEVHGDGTCAIATNGEYVFVGVSGHVHALPLRTPWTGKPAWTNPHLLGDRHLPVRLLVKDGRLFAACHGFVHELDPRDGRTLQEIRLGDAVPADRPVTLASDDQRIYAGTHAYVYALPLGQPWDGRTLWYSKKLGNALVYQPVTVSLERGRLFAASNGHAYELQPATGHTLQEVEFADAGVGDWPADFATDGGRLYVGSHAHACSLPLDRGWGAEPEWRTESLSALIDHGPVRMLYAGDRLFAACDGWAYDLDPLTGAVRQQWELTSPLATPLPLATGLAAAGAELYAGVHGHVHGMLLTGLLDAPTAAWPLDQTSGTAVRDRRGLFPATAKDVAWTPLSALGACAVFNGRSSLIQTSGKVLDTAPDKGFSVSAWVRLDSLPGNAAILSQAGNVASGFVLGYSAATQCWYFERYAADDRNPIPQRVGSKLMGVARIWTHLTAVYDPAAVLADGSRTAQMRLYVDGELSGSKDLGTSGFGFAAGGPFRIGVRRYNGKQDAWLPGAVRDVRVYGHALHDVQLEPQATSFWRLDETSGMRAADQSRAHDAVAHDVRWQHVPGIGGCATLHSPASGLTTREPVVRTGVGGGFTVAAWVRMDADPGHRVVLLGQDARTLSAFTLEYLPGSWNFVRYTADRAGASAVTAVSGVPAAPGEWTHVAGVYDAGTQTMRVYVNGAEKQAKEFDGASAFDANGAFTIGYGRYNDGLSARLPGTVRDVRAYNQALSAAQVAALLDRAERAAEDGEAHALTAAGAGAGLGVGAESDSV